MQIQAELLLIQRLLDLQKRIVMLRNQFSIFLQNLRCLKSLLRCGHLLFSRWKESKMFNVLAWCLRGNASEVLSSLIAGDNIGNYELLKENFGMTICSWPHFSKDHIRTVRGVVRRYPH